MITPRRSRERGHADHGWLDARHTFSFAGYFDPRHMGFSELRVLNQDVVQPGQGFGTHGHESMEIVTYVLRGALEHRDSMGNGSRMRNGEVQYMKAGSGVRHSEFNASEDEELELLQMWVLPAEEGGAPRYEQKEFGEAERRGTLRLVVSPDGADGSIRIDQDARMYAGLFREGEQHELRLAPGRRAWVHVARGTVRLDDVELGPGDGAAVEGQAKLQVQGTGDEAELVVWDLP